MQYYMWFISAISNVLGDELQCPNNYTVRTTMKLLRKHAFCSYDRTIRPVRKSNDTVDVRVRLLLRRIEFVSALLACYRMLYINIREISYM